MCVQRVSVCAESLCVCRKFVCVCVCVQIVCDRLVKRKRKGEETLMEGGREEGF